MATRYLYAMGEKMHGPFDTPSQAEEDWREGPARDDASLWVIWEEEGEDPGEIAHRLKELKEG